jgi:hypothetical protein
MLTYYAVSLEGKYKKGKKREDNVIIKGRQMKR